MSGRRVVVLARAGAARERTEQAVRAAGAELAASLDPTEADEAAVLARAPHALVVVLDAATESVLERYDALLADPALDVIFDDAEVAAKRDGWEAARWARHLAAKLEGHDDVLPAAPERGSRVGFEEEMQALALQVAALPEVPQAPAHAPASPIGAVAIVAGIGGPDAVRQLLSTLPSGFPRPVLLRQKLEGGHYDKLLRQMQRATSLQVVLAQPGDRVEAGHVYIMPDGVDVARTETGMAFVAGRGEPHFSGLPAADSALLLLSGADPSAVDIGLALRLTGAMVYGQAPENCFDPSASRTLVTRGGESRSLAEMSRELLHRWSA
ncbi:chemotaxis protein CheB [Thermomonas alba]|uniref:chemotaxis protein CheB n=1 Tax=Thermomonas alba TaxID=2888525 RepID=UPI001F0365B8|nr:chemotaxis protein CheB [Thermomonas alba]